MAWIERAYDKPWMKLRLVVLACDQYLCQACRRAGWVTAAKAVGHIMAKAKGGTDDLENLEAICGPCHREDHRRSGQTGAASH